MAELELYAGDTLAINLVVRDAAGEEVDITGVSSIRFGLARSVREATLVEKNLDDGVELTDPSVGGCTITLSPADTEALPSRIYYFEVELVLGGETSTVSSGTIRVKPTLIHSES